LTGSTSSSATLAREAVGRISTLTLKPRASAARATAAPTKPEAPVTRTRSLMTTGPTHRRASFNGLPIEQHRHAKNNFARPLEQRHGQAQFGWQAEQRRQHRIAGFL